MFSIQSIVGLTYLSYGIAAGEGGSAKENFILQKRVVSQMYCRLKPDSCQESFSFTGLHILTLYALYIQNEILFVNKYDK
jgi:hypothetical protein